MTDPTAIDHNAAELIATALLGRTPKDAERPWQLVAFPRGWLIAEDSADDARGAATHIIETTGKVVRFPSSVPPGRIMESYPALVSRGRMVTLPE